MIIPQQKQPQNAHEASPLRPGAHMLHGRNSLGTWISGKPSRGDFSHPFTVVLAGNSARISKGIVIPEAGAIAVEPVIGSVPISGGDTSRQPTLKLESGLVNEDGESWICVEVTPDPEGKRAKASGQSGSGSNSPSGIGLDPGVLDASSKVEVVQRDAPVITADSPTGRVPLALLTFRGGAAKVFQIAMFNFKYRLVVPPAGQGPRRHHFL